MPVSFFFIFFHLIRTFFRPGFAGSRCELGKKKNLLKIFHISAISIEYFRCPTNGFYADAYGCAQGKYFECVEQSLLLIISKKLNIFLLFFSHSYLSFMSSRSSLQFLPWSL
jgi:hypothetical protein